MSNLGSEIVRFLKQSPDAFHAVSTIGSRLAAAGFIPLSERTPWSLQPGQKYFLTRNKSCICAFSVGAKFKPSNGFKMISGHVDSPCLKLKPVTSKQSEGFHQIGVQLYGGGIWHSWFDRDLAIAGRVILRRQEKLCERLVQIDEPLMKVPNICIHLNRDHNEKFSPNLERHTVPLISTVEEHNKHLLDSQDGQKAIGDKSKQSPVLMKLLSDKLECGEEDIVDFDLGLYDFNPPCVGGAYKEFIFAPRQDNLLTCFMATQAIIDSCEKSLEAEEQIRVMFLYDNEEVGSLSFQGADSRLSESILRRINSCVAEKPEVSPDSFEQAINNSFHMSWDAAHYVHPNYSDKHEDSMKPKMGKGPILKYHCNMRYSTSARSAAITRQMAHECNVPLQEFRVKNDSPCGSTVGPILAGKLGLETVDLGVGLLSMHSIRETGCVADVSLGIQLMNRFFSSPLPTVECD